MTQWANTAVLLMAYGTPARREDVEAYYTHIRHGRPPSQAELEDLLSRYDAIGGLSPLWQITQRQAAVLQAELNRRHGVDAVKVYLGMKHAHPFIADAIEEILADGRQRVVGLVLAPHYSAMSVGTYLDEAKRALADRRPFFPVESWATHPGLITLLAERIQEIRRQFSDAEQQDLPIIFTAHSLPQRILALKDPYPDELKRTGDRVAEVLGTTHYTFSWQSAGRTREPWMGPDILEKLTQMAADGFRQAIICPAGFVADHLEVLYDLDIQAQQHARQLGMHIERTRSLNDDPALGRILADVVEGALQHD
ncbi:ferrochelatase [Sulfobacillus acidophilus TPY]|uniref:Coproporphyrin III ferrochelatase n=1 Tax=Sulfobacillus acidophilus (strain ATCC 700253 / DSM 10332 / NAL) TaxID=679936 RepID=G8TY29_SULAD|nr:ferrochelatase [Sulfobacillus acidophilus TPY]AEW03936.1 ferrochelatase [Sulfobacillus acidophilus DSM 10332]